MLRSGILALALVACAPAPSTPAFAAASGRWTEIEALVRARFPGVEGISGDELAAELNDPQEQPPLLLDVREEAEYAVSHLPGARRARTTAEALEILDNGPREREIVVYCSVGYRSAELANELEGAGFTNVRNLEGSIFAWANAGRPIVDAHGATHKVHPFDAEWGNLLRPELRAPLPGEPASGR